MSTLATRNLSALRASVTLTWLVLSVTLIRRLIRSKGEYYEEDQVSPFPLPTYAKRVSSRVRAGHLGRSSRR